MKLFQLGLVVTYRKAARPENTCDCAWCKERKQEGIRGIAPPHHAKVMAARKYCEKKVAPVDSGFEGTYPTYDASCFLCDLSDKRQQFFSSKLGCTQLGVLHSPS